MSERLVSKIKVRKPRGTWLMEFTIHRTVRKYYGPSYIMDTDEERFVVPCGSWSEAMTRAGYVLVNLGVKK